MHDKDFSNVLQFPCKRSEMDFHEWQNFDWTQRCQRDALLSLLQQLFQ